MKKVTNITLGGSVFVIEEEAYEKLSKYLQAIEMQLSKNNDSKEIVFDIENAIAEKFLQIGKNEKHAVSDVDVTTVIAEMGSAEDITKDEAKGDSKENVTDTTQQEVAKKRLYRDTDDAVFAGVASGIARYFDIDPVVVRLLFVIAIFFDGFGILAYVILWFVVPPAETTAQKYAMRGERMTIAEISEHVRSKLHTIDTKEFDNAKGAWNTIRTLLQKMFSVLGNVIKNFLHYFKYFFGFACVLLGALGIASLVSLSSVIWIGEISWLPFELQHVATFLLANTSGYLLLSALFVTLFIPFIVVLILGGSLLSGKNHFTLTKAISLGVLWVIALSLIVSLSLIFTPRIKEDPYLKNISEQTIGNTEILFKKNNQSNT